MVAGGRAVPQPWSVLDNLAHPAKHPICCRWNLCTQPLTSHALYRRKLLLPFFRL